MRHLLTNNIDTNIGMPIKSGTLDHLQNAYIEILNALAQSIIGNNYNSGTVYVLYGLVNSGTISDPIISDGYVYYGGEIYAVTGGTFSGTVGLIFNTNYYLGTNADPVEFTNGDIHNVHEIRYSNIGSGGSPIYTDFVRFDWIIINSPSFVTISTGTGSISACYLRYRQLQDTIILNYIAVGNISSYASGHFEGKISLPISANVTGINDGIANCGISTLSDGNNYPMPTSIFNLFTSTPDKLNFTINNSLTGSFSIFGQITYPI